MTTPFTLSPTKEPSPSLTPCRPPPPLLPPKERAQPSTHASPASASFHLPSALPLSPCPPPWLVPGKGLEGVDDSKATPPANLPPPPVSPAQQYSRLLRLSQLLLKAQQCIHLSLG
jgi:hypothetical protein